MSTDQDRQIARQRRERKLRLWLTTLSWSTPVIAFWVAADDLAPNRRDSPSHSLSSNQVTCAEAIRLTNK